MRIHRRLFERFLGFLFLLQLVVIGSISLIPRSGEISIFLLLCSVDLLLILAGLALVWRMNRAADDHHERLVRWINDIDVSADDLPTPPANRIANAPQLLDAVRTLVIRLHDYRKKLQIRHQRVQRLLRKVTDVLYHIDQDARLTWVTDSVTDMLGYSPRELQDYPLAKLLVDADTDLPILTQRANIVRHPVRVFHHDGGIAWLLISARRLDDADGRFAGSEGICRDGTRLIETQRQLDQEKERAQVTLAAIGDGVITTDANGIIDYINPRGQDMLARSMNEVQCQDFENVCRLFDLNRQEFVQGLVANCLKSGISREWTDPLALVDHQGPIRDPDNHRSVTVTVSAIRDEKGQIIGAVVVLHDITRLERVSRELTYQANHDSLTGLINRRAFEYQLKRVLESARLNNLSHTLCYLDLDQFKLVNDSCGHHAGDAMLRQLSSQMVTQLRPHDTLARLGGDEFGIIFEGIELGAAHAVADRLRQWLEGFRFEWAGKSFRLGASLGLSAIDGSSVSAAELLRRADSACYLAKEQGRNQIRTYHRDSDEARMRDYEIARMQQINEALDNHRFELYAQPIVPLAPDAEQAQIGTELLLRMDSSDAMISPQDILLTAERYSLASRIDRWVISRAFELFARHAAECPRIDYFSINISGQSITDEQFIGFVRENIERSGMNPQRLVFEITETAAVTNLRRAAELMRSLRAIGCRFALDDFGSGVTSFSYLKDLPTDFVKIDGRLVDHVTDDPIERTIIDALSKVSQAVGLHTVAEHVETREQIKVLEEIGIDYVQGYYVARPMPFPQFVILFGERVRT